jgi:hypothetical protein
MQFQQLNTPSAIQECLDSMPYIGEERNRSPLQVMLDRQCHCVQGAAVEPRDRPCSHCRDFTYQPGTSLRESGF